MATLLPSIEDAASDVANGNRVESTSSVPCYLLKLPWEVRNKILRYLLYSDEPLRLLERGFDDDENQGEDDEGEEESDDMEDNDDDTSEDDEDDQSEKNLDEECRKEGCHKNYAFSTQVMRTCRQLYDEGKLVLGSNTVGIDLCGFSNYQWQWAVVGWRQKNSRIDGMKLDRTIKRLFHEAHKFHIFMDLRELREASTYNDWCDQYMSYPIPRLCKHLIEKQNLKQCRIDVTIEGFANEESYLYEPEKAYLYQPEEMGCSFLASFQMLRCNDFSIIGCNEHTGHRLQRSILADEPARNLWTMYDALKKFVKGSSCLRDDHLDHSECELDCDSSNSSNPLGLGLMAVLEICPRIYKRSRCKFYWNLIEEAVMWGHVQRFLGLRSALLETIDEVQAKKERELLELDFACRGFVKEKKHRSY